MYYVINNKILDFSRTEVMGILNITPDSFFDGGRYLSFSQAIDHVATMIQLGARFIDIGGESTRPGALKITENEEVDRVVPIISAISKRFDIFISVNTSKSLVIRESAEVGAHLINDVRSLSKSGALKTFLSYSHLSVCLTHMQGSPDNMQNSPYYHNVIQEVNDYFKERIVQCEMSGVTKDRLFIDPGFGFGKTLLHNYELLAHLGDFHHFRLPIIVGISRKSMLDLCDNKPPSQRLIGSLSASVISAIQGIQILRVHDVGETIEALQIVHATLKNRRKYFV